MILEIAFVEVAPERHSDFEKAVKRAVSEVLSAAPGFIDLCGQKRGHVGKNVGRFLLQTTSWWLVLSMITP